MSEEFKTFCLTCGEPLLNDTQLQQHNLLACIQYLQVQNRKLESSRDDWKESYHKLRSNHEETVIAANSRIAELTEQADSAYAPYRQMVQEAREEVDKFSERLADMWHPIAEPPTDTHMKLLIDMKATVECGCGLCVTTAWYDAPRKQWVSKGSITPTHWQDILAPY